MLSSEYCWKRRSFKRLKKESILITITRVLGYKTLPFPAILPFPMQVGAIEHGLSETPHTEHLANQPNPAPCTRPLSFICSAKVFPQRLFSRPRARGQSLACEVALLFPLTLSLFLAAEIAGARKTK